MPVQQCPFCQTTLKVPRKHLGHPIDCPRCHRPFLAAVHESSRGAPPPLPPKTSPQPADAGANVPRPNDEASATVRLVRPKPTATVLTPSPDGTLPGLSLSEQPQRRAPDLQAIKSNPLVMALLFALSLGSSALILLVDFDAGSRDTRSQVEARRKLREFCEAKPDTPLEPYQIELRQAQQAHSRGDRRAERAYYRKVMDRLLAEDRNPYAGVTGSPTRDIELQSYLSLLLSDEKSAIRP